MTRGRAATRSNRAGPPEPPGGPRRGGAAGRAGSGHDRWTDGRIRSSRPPRSPADPQRPIGHTWEEERRIGGGTRRTLTVFLAGAECPFTCLFCDLWRHTIDGPTPSGALPGQLARALAGAGPAGAGTAIKLYNASNFFDRRAVPPEDDAELARLCGPFERVTVECHPRLLGGRCEAFAHALRGRLEVAMGLETVHPDVFPRLNKGMAPEAFDRAVAWARERGIGTRAFVLVGLPWVAADAFATWAARSAAHASRLGVDRVSLIPLRRGNGALDALADEGALAPVGLAHVERALALALEAADGGTIVEADPWDLEPLAVCRACGPARLAAVRRANLSQTPPARAECACGT